MALDDTTDRPTSKGRYETAKEIEMRNYLEIILRLSKKDPDIIYRVIELAKEKEGNK